MRLFVEIDDELMERALPYIKDEKAKTAFLQIAFEEWVTRHESRDRRAQEERALKDEATVRKVIERMKQEGQL